MIKLNNHAIGTKHILICLVFVIPSFSSPFMSFHSGEGSGVHLDLGMGVGASLIAGLSLGF